MATHSSILAWRNPWTEEPGGLQSLDHKALNITVKLAKAKGKAKSESSNSTCSKSPQ